LDGMSHLGRHWTKTFSNLLKYYWNTRKIKSEWIRSSRNMGIWSNTIIKHTQAGTLMFIICFLQVLYYKYTASLWKQN
jgi:hypothetical protein